MNKIFVVLVLVLQPAFLFSQSEYSTSLSERLHFSGEAAAAFFDTEEEGQFPNHELRVDEAKLFVEANIVTDIYIFAEINFIVREEEETLDLGELYLDFENVSKLWNQERVLNLRVGRFDIPFGEEYLTRDAIDNPLVTHSLIDFWGVDEGVEVYGFIKNWEYVVAIQNGGEPVTNDFHPDKSIAARILYRPAPVIHFSLSAMRTGDLDVEQDKFSELWFGNGFLRVLGSPNTTTTFQANLFEIDGHAMWPMGHLHIAGGGLRYEDDDTAADNSRDVYYFQIEALQNLNRNKETPWYGVARFSRISANKGFPLVGNGKLGLFLFNDSTLTEELWRLSLGAGYRIKRNFLIKAEYNFENGTRSDGRKRDAENFFGIEAAVRF